MNGSVLMARDPRSTSATAFSTICSTLVRVLEVGIQRDGLADRSAEQLVDRHAERLAFDVPQRDVDAADHRRRRAARARRR